MLRQMNEKDLAQPQLSPARHDESFSSFNKGQCAWCDLMAMVWRRVLPYANHGPPLRRCATSIRMIMKWKTRTPAIVNSQRNVKIIGAIYYESASFSRLIDWWSLINSSADAHQYNLIVFICECFNYYWVAEAKHKTTNMYRTTFEKCHGEYQFTFFWK